MGVVWSLTSGSASVPLWCYNEDFWLLKPHPLIMGNERGITCTSVDIFNVVRCLILFLPPPRQCTTLSLWAYLRLVVSRSIGIKPGYVASGWT